MTTDVAAAKLFYAEVAGWAAQDTPASEPSYALFSAGKTAVAGLMELPAEARKMGATPRWMGYVSVDDLEMTTRRIEGLGGAVYVPATDSNIGRIAVVADPQTATLGLVKGLKVGRKQPAELATAGHMGWHELFAADADQAFGFYREIFGWAKADAETTSIDTYQLFTSGGLTIGGMCTKSAREPVPYWLFYVNVQDFDGAAERVRRGGGRMFEGPLELPGGSLIARCVDPQGAAFALQGKRSERGIGWTAEWGGISSRGRMVTRGRA
jgi:uncharacterized protein